MVTNQFPGHSLEQQNDGLPLFGESGKATGVVAFRLIPVLMAFLISSVSILWLTAFRPASQSRESLRESLIDPTNTQSGQATFESANGDPAISQVFTKEIQYWEPQIQGWAIEFGLNPNLVAVVMQIESCGHPNIQSSAGALGLFQVMPFHFHEGENPLDPSINALRGLSYLTRSLEISKGDPSLALAGYNGGHSVIQWDRGFWANETSRYVHWGSGILEDINSGLTKSPRLSEWLTNGGESLCNQAADALDM